jgi:hypothetical protein
MKSIPATPFARLSLKDQQSYLLNVEPTAWPEHVQEAYQIVLRRRPQVAKQMTIDAVAAAHRIVRKAYEAQLRDERSSTLATFCKACKELSNATKPNRLLKAVRTKIDEAARTIFAGGVADLETIQRFLRECDVAGKRNLALDYEASAAHFSLECESALERLILEEAQSITAHEIFATLYEASLRCTATKSAQGETDLLQEYLAELDGIWTNHGIRVGRGNHDDDAKYIGPFPEFAERVLLSQRRPGSNLFEPVSAEELETVRRRYYEMSPEGQRASSARPFHDVGLITDRILRGYLDQRAVSKKSG